MKLRVLSLSLLLASSVAFAQQTEIPVKSTPAEETLIKLATQNANAQKAFNDLRQQAITNLDTLNKPILDDMKARSAKWQAKMDAENKDLKAKLDDNTKKANDQLQKETAGLQGVAPGTFATLEEVVRQEQNLPPAAKFDQVKKVWTVPAGTPTATATPPPAAK